MRDFHYNKRVVSILLASLISFGNVDSVLGQAKGTGSLGVTMPADSGRMGGTSFGTKEERGVSLPFLPIPNTQIFQEQTTGGLTYQVHILGEVNKPGTYRLAASTRLSEALEKAGGLLERGSERRIELRRQGGGNRQVDLLSFKQVGNLDANPYLLDNDVIFIPLREKVVQIAGTVRRPGTYELKNEKTMEDLVRLAGGFTPGVGNPAPIKVIRFKHGKKEILDLENKREARERFQLENADVVVVPHFLTQERSFDYNLPKLPGDNQLFYPSYEDRIFVLGGVFAPGPYPFSPYYSVRQYLTLAGGTTKVAKKRRIKIIGNNGKRYRPDDKTLINPGDTVFVPERYLPPESILSLVLGVTASVLGITATVLTLSR